MTRRPKWYRPSIKRLGGWHQLMGLTAAAFVALLSISGILLNHTDSLSLDRRYVQTGWLLDWYGVHAPAIKESYRAAGHWVTQVGDRLYVDARELSGSFGRLIGAVALEDVIVIAVDRQLLLLSRSGELIERVEGRHGVPAGMKAVGIGPRGRLIVQAAHGHYHTDKDLLSWRETRTATAEWAKPATTPPELIDSLRQQYRGRGLTVERVLLDLHSGRILGRAGTLLMDLAALLMILLAITGVWIWAKRRKS